MRCMNRHLLLLSFCQSLFLTNNVTFIAINGLVGLALAPVGWMATLPVTAYVLGSAAAAMPVSWMQAHWGRRRSFQFGLCVAMLACALGAYAVVSRNFWLLLLATVVAGFYAANAALYRFTGPELVAPRTRKRPSPTCWRAASWVPSSGPTWPVPRGTCCPCPSPGPTWC
jgi:MFS family permease